LDSTSRAHFAASFRVSKVSTNNCRSEEAALKPTFRDAWRKGQRCIIPAESFDEPCWETGKNVWWRFRRVDGQPWALAGLWNTWVDYATGEVIESYTMLTVNADDHPIMSRMHKPDPKLPPDQQDKRSVVAIEQGDVDQWLQGSVGEAGALLTAPAVKTLRFGSH
jgi:putative SOS response-associated peptidase YedK